MRGLLQWDRISNSHENPLSLSLSPVLPLYFNKPPLPSGFSFRSNFYCLTTIGRNSQEQ